MTRKKLMIGNWRCLKRSKLIIGIIIWICLEIVTTSVYAAESSKYIKIEGNNYQGETVWDYDYTGISQSFCAPVNGTYQFEIYGAQGEGYEAHIGGYGGSVLGTIELKKGENINIIVGGTNGYNGGGTGTLSNGGGATQIEKNGSLIAIAGGGGGATNITDGNAGGSASGTNEKFLEGSDSDMQYSAGGGAGYAGGNSGYTIYHSHMGNETEGGMCYATPVYHVHEGEPNVAEGCYTIPIYHIHEGESAYYGGCYTNVNYHVHQGNETILDGCYTVPKYHAHSGEQLSGGGCYTNPVMHEHSDSCPKTICTGTSFTARTDTSGSNTYTNYYCDKCHYGWSQLKSVCGREMSTCQKGGTVEYYTLACGLSENSVEGYELGCGMLTTTPESYSLACEKTEESIDYYKTNCGMDFTTIIGYQKSCSKIENESIDDYKAAFGGSNYYNSGICTDVKSNAGVNAGNGRVSLVLVAVDGATISYYNDDLTLLKEVTVAKGDNISYPFTENPSKSTDEKYSYTFAGWDNTSTEEIEQYSNEETVKNTSESFQFKAVYNKIGRSYTLSLDSQEAENMGTQSVNVTYGQEISDIEIPNKANHIFVGYFTLPQGLGKQYYNSVGAATCASDITSDTILYAHWIQPITIVKQPMDKLIATGYKGVVIELDTVMTANGDFTVKYQWYQKQSDVVVPITDAVGKHFLLPENYAVGEYSIFCEIVVTDNTNQQSYTTYSNTINVQVTKGKIEATQINSQQNAITYDGKYHSVVVNVDIASNYTIYYSKEELNAENYAVKGQKHPLNFKNAGNYEIYYYITSPEFEDYVGKTNYVIYKAKPEILVISKNASYTGNVIHIDAAKVLGVNNSYLSDQTVTYTYYTDEKCLKKTSQEDGADESGTAPSEVGSYYVVVGVAETENYVATEIAAPVLLNILQTTVDFEIKGYTGVYDKMEHGIVADVKNNGNLTFYYSTDVILTADNYEIEGTTISPMFKNAGIYKIYYLAVNKLTGKLNSYIPGDVTITIFKAKQYITNENYPVLNNKKNTVSFPKGGEWEYKKADSSMKWKHYMNESLDVGIYVFRLEETDNYYASESVVIQAKKIEEDKKGDDSSSDKKEESVPETKPEVELEVTPQPPAEKPDIKEDFPPDNEKEEQKDILPDDENHNGNSDEYEQDLNGNGIPDFLECKMPMESDAEAMIVEIDEEPVPLVQDFKPTVVDKIKETVKEIMSEENAKIVVPCVTVGMVIGLIVSYLALILLSPFIKMKTKYCYFIETMLTGKTTNHKVNINTELASIDETRKKEGIYSFGQLCKNEDYIVTIQDKNNYSVGVIRLTFIKKRIFHEIIINRGIEIRVEQLKHGARIHVR